jgi:hypothetical protein
MLTENQLTQLAELEKHPIYGKLLCDASKNWKTDVNPNRWNFGISIDDSNFIICPDKTACLVGSALIGNQIGQYELCLDLAKEKYNLTHSQIYNLIRGFDGRNVSCENKDAYEFGQTVAKIIFG